MLKIRLIEVYRLMKVRRRYHEHSIDTCRRNRRASYARQAETVRISAGKMIITHCLEAVSVHPKIDAIQIVADEEWRERIYEQMPEAALRKFSGFQNPVPTGSVRFLMG